MRCINIRVLGKVQGVGFRLNVSRWAKDLDIKGFVRNEPDGSVYIEAKGKGSALDKLVENCRKGPRLSRVREVEIKEIDTKDFQGFEIIY